MDAEGAEPSNGDTCAVGAAAAAIRLVLTDVDGVLTDGRVYVSDSGEYLSAFDIHDGAGIKYLQLAGLEVGIVSGRANEAVRHRAERFGITEIHLGHIPKWPVVEQIMARRGLRAEQLAYLGDDLTDVPVLRRVGLAGAVPNARSEVLAEADWVAEHAGGRGAFRDFAELILKHQGKWEDILRRYDALPDAIGADDAGRDAASPGGAAQHDA